MELNFDRDRSSTLEISPLVGALTENETELGLSSSFLYYDFPIIKDSDDNVSIAQMLLISKNHGILVFQVHNSRESIESDSFRRCVEHISNTSALIFSRLIRNKALRVGVNNLGFPIHLLVFSPSLSGNRFENISGAYVTFTIRHVIDILQNLKLESPISETLFSELISTIEGAKGIIKKVPRVIDPPRANSPMRGQIADVLDSSIAKFDFLQKQGTMSVLDGFQRIRGLAGSGKTIVLCMKAALTHLRNPKSKILYTFYTKSLYQHIQRLITRFYRQFDDKDPNWDFLEIRHAWGGQSSAGVYSSVCSTYGVIPKTFKNVPFNTLDPFDYVCTDLVSRVSINPKYDYCFIDEGQDFPASFVRICVSLTNSKRVVYAYDELQTIFQVELPKISDIIPGADLSQDVVLRKCYRNPREILFCAHALGFGIYGNIVQMIESRESWEDIGYLVRAGTFNEGDQMIIERPEDTSSCLLAAYQRPEQIIKTFSFPDVDREYEKVCKLIADDIKSGLRPEDVLVISVDDRFAKAYLKGISNGLNAMGVSTNDIHNTFSPNPEFQIPGQVTLSTVHKAKGNEAFSVYIVGVDALYKNSSARDRNKLFTAMTRSKGWLTVTGLGSLSKQCEKEIATAMEKFPIFEFVYPDPKTIKMLKEEIVNVRDMPDDDMLDEVLRKYSIEEIQARNRRLKRYKKRK